MARVAVFLGLLAVVVARPPLYRHAVAAAAAGGSPAVVGNLGCAAAACHGDTQHATVSDRDPHRRAFGVLFHERSVRMVRTLGGTAPAHQDARCLSCHGAAPPNAAPLPADDYRHRSASCENCHGAAGNYLTTHYLPGKPADGLMATKDLAVRAAVCAGCHVGEPGREVDHALIAAGHPALRFELAAYSAAPVYARHWVEPPREGAEWLVGQVAAARASAELLRHRAATAGKRDWPELAEFACFSCHQGLTGEPTPVRANAPPAGRLPWGTWAYPLTLSLADGPTESRPPAGDGLTRLAALFRETDRPEAKATADAATAAVAHLDRWLVQLRDRPPTDFRPLLAHAVKFAGDVPRTGSPAADWDRTAQGFLATAALYRATGERSPAAEAALADIASRLRFPAGRDSPAKSPTARDRLARRWAELGGRP